jgi:hypothetical protein
LKTVIGLFETREEVQDAVERLKDEGFEAKDISLMMRNTEDAEIIQNDTGANVAGGTVSGLTTGAVIGGLAGLVSAIAIPGLGAFFIGGPIAAALGLTGAAASTVSGAATGALAGGLLGALTGLGLSEEDAQVYETRVREGAILAAVPVGNRDEHYVRRIFEDYNASDVKTIDQTTRATVDEFEEIDDTPASYRDTDYRHAGAYMAGAKGGKSVKKVKVRPGETVRIESEED